MSDPIRPGLWEHYKSQADGSLRLYCVLGVVKHVDTEEEIVIYFPLYLKPGVELPEIVYRPANTWFDTQRTIRFGYVARFRFAGRTTIEMMDYFGDRLGDQPYTSGYLEIMTAIEDELGELPFSFRPHVTQRAIRKLVALINRLDRDLLVSSPHSVPTIPGQFDCPPDSTVTRP